MKMKTIIHIVVHLEKYLQVSSFKYFQRYFCIFRVKIE